MKAIQTWKNKKDSIETIVILYKDKLIYTVEEHDQGYDEEFNFNELFSRKFPLISQEIDYTIFKKVVEQTKPTDLGINESRIWNFWKALNNKYIKEEKLFIEEKKFLNKSKYGFADGIVRYDGEEMLYSKQRIDEFFFYGPYLYGISIEDRMRIRQEIYDSLENIPADFVVEDGFIIFDYNKIEEIEFEKIDGIRGSYFKIIDGKVTIGGWENPKDGGEGYSSIEFLWYNIETHVPAKFRDKIPYIKSVLEKAIVI